MSEDDRHRVELPPDLDEENLAEAALAILSLSKHDYGDVWKTLDWNLLNLLFQKGWIEDPISKKKSVGLTKDGEALAEKFLRRHFGK